LTRAESERQRVESREHRGRGLGGEIRGDQER